MKRKDDLTMESSLKTKDNSIISQNETQIDDKENKSKIENASTDKNSKDDSDDNFEEKNSHLLSQIELLRSMEIRFKQTININDKEKENPKAFIDFLKKIKMVFSLELDAPSSKNFFKPVDLQRPDFEQMLDGHCGNDTLRKGTTRFFIYIVLLSRKSMDYRKASFNGLSHNYNFDIRDIYHIKDIHAKCFKDLTKIPPKIIKRCQRSSYDCRQVAQKFVKKFENSNNALLAIQNKQQSIVSSNDMSEKEKEKQIENLEKEKNKVSSEIEKLSFEVQEELTKNDRLDDPEVKDICSFLADFIDYAISIPHSVANNKNIIKEGDTLYTNNVSSVATISLENLNFPNVSKKVWEKPEETIAQNIWRLSGVRNFSKANEEVIINNLLSEISEKPYTKLIVFRPNTIFLKNGIIELHMEADSLKDYRFIYDDDLTVDEIMFKYPTLYRAEMVFNPQAPQQFDNYSLGQKITVDPTFIFEALGRRGFETHDYMEQSEIDYLNQQAYERSNLLKQFLLNTLVFYNELPNVDRKFLYLYNAANSGKSSFINLMHTIVGQNGVGDIDISDLDIDKASFGLINIQNKYLVTIDEATDGNEIIDAKNLKKLVTKNSKISANRKHKGYVSFYPNASFLLASNYPPRFADESEGTERRFLAFQLASGYQQKRNDGRPTDLSFINDELVLDDQFASACLIHALNTVNTSLPVPQSVLDDANSVTKKEDEVDAFINDRIRNVIDEPLFITGTDLYELYKLEMASLGRKPTSIRNSSNFIKAIEKLRNSVFSFKRNNIHNVYTTNTLLWLTGKLFSEDVDSQDSNKTLFNLTTKYFKTIVDKRYRYMQKLYDDILEYQDVNCNKQLSRVGISKKTTYVILPNLDEYNDYTGNDGGQSFKQIARQQRDIFNKTFLNESNMKIIKKGYDAKYNHNKKNDELDKIYKDLPFQIQKNIPSRFTDYQIKDNPLDDYHHSYSELLIE